MESTPQTLPPGRSLAAVLEIEQVIPPQRARSLLNSLAGAQVVPAQPEAPLGWIALITIVPAGDRLERAEFRSNGGSPAERAETGASRAMRHIEALRISAMCMLWGTHTVSSLLAARGSANPEARVHFPRLRALLWDDWDATRRTCSDPQSFMTVFDATLAQDKAAEANKPARGPMMTLGIPIPPTPAREVAVGTISMKRTPELERLLTPRDTIPVVPPPRPAESPKSRLVPIVVGVAVVLATIIGYVLHSR